MPNAYFYTGFIQLKNALVRAPILYDDTWPATKPPYAYVVYNNCKYISKTLNVNNPNINIIRLNTDSPLWIYQNGALVGAWLEAYNDPNMAETTVITFANNNYITAKRETNNTMTIKCYSYNGTRAGQINIGNFSSGFGAVGVYKADDNDVFLNYCRIVSLQGTQYSFIMNDAAILINGFSMLDNTTIETEDPYYFSDESGPGGGFGDFDYSGDSVLPPDLPTISVADSGFVTLFAPSIGQLQSLANYMWSGLFDVATFKKIFADPMDCIISLNILPVTLPQGSAQTLKVGNISTGIDINILSAQFIKVKFAARNIGVRTKSFMDYSPYVKAQLFLPFIGARSISIDEIADAEVGIEYHIDLFSGACTAYVTINKVNSDGSVIHSSLYQFNGNVCANIPFTATNYNGFLGSLLQTAAAVTTAVATQGSSSAVAGALSSGIDTATAIKPDVERSGNMSATNGFLGIQKPYLIITYPHVCKPDCRDKTVGTPSFIGLSSSKKLNSFHKLTTLHRINAKGIPCTEQERRLIIDQLTGEGVILP